MKLRQNKMDPTPAHVRFPIFAAMAPTMGPEKKPVNVERPPTRAYCVVVVPGKVFWAT